MENCKVTQLKSVVNNDNLIKFNTITIRCDLRDVSNTGDRILKLDGTNYHIKILETGVTYTVNGLSNPTSEGTYSGNNTFYFPAQQFTIELNGKYNLTKIEQQVPETSIDIPMYFNWDEFSGCSRITFIRTSDASALAHKGSIDNLKDNTAMTYLRILGNQTSGDISSLSGMVSLGELHLENTSISGNLSSLSACNALTSLTIRNCSVYGKLEDIGNIITLQSLKLDSKINGSIEAFVHAQYDAGREPLTLSTGVLGDNLLNYVTFGGSLKNRNYCRIAWDSRTRMFVLAADNSDLSGNARIYCAGYTRAEAQEKWASSWGSVVTVDNWNGTGN